MLGADAGREAGSLWVVLQAVPVPEVRATRGSVVNDDVVGVRHPEGRGRDVIVT